MTRPHWFLLLALAMLVSIAIASLSAVMERLEGLKQARETEARLVEALLRAAVADAPEGQDAPSAPERVSTALDALGGRGLQTLRLPIELYQGDRLVASNVAPESLEQWLERLGRAPAAMQSRPLGGDWRLRLVLPDDAHDFESWHAPLSVPYRKLREGHDLTPGALFDHTWVPAQLVVMAASVLVALFYAYSRWTRRRIVRLEDGLDAAVARERAGRQRAEALRAAGRSADAELSAARTRLTALEQAHSSAREALQAAREAGALDRERRQSLEQRMTEGAEALAASRARVEHLQAQKAQAEQALQAAMELLDEEAERLSALEQRRDAAVRENAASARATRARMLQRIWDLRWHEVALQEAGELFRAGQPAERRQLRELLCEVAATGLGRRPGERWSPYKSGAAGRTDWIWHNGGRQRAKLYWAQDQDGPTVLSVAKGGDAHQKYQGAGERLFQRLQGLRARSARAS